MKDWSDDDAPTTLWLATYDTTDFYCEGNHIIGLYSTEQGANEAVERFKAANVGAYSYEYEVDTIQVDPPPSRRDQD